MTRRLSVARMLACALCLPLLLGGCSTTTVYAPEHLANADDEVIAVTTTDGRVIRFRRGDYVVVESGGGTLQGKGELVTNHVSNATVPWSGGLALGEIASVSATRVNLLGVAAIAAALVLPAWYLLYGSAGGH